jgi:hypothetical protein
MHGIEVRIEMLAGQSRLSRDFRPSAPAAIVILASVIQTGSLPRKETRAIGGTRAAGGKGATGGTSRAA